MSAAIMGAAMNAAGAATNIIDSDEVIALGKGNAMPNQQGYEYLDELRFLRASSKVEFRGNRPSFESIVLPMNGNVIARPAEVVPGANYAGLKMVYENLRTGVIFITNQVWGRRV